MSTELNAANTDSHRFVEQATAPATPASGFGTIYQKTDGLFYSKDDAGVETLMSSGVSTGDMLAATYDPATISEQLVGLVATQTLTNKTMDFASNTFQNVGQGILARISGSTYSTIQHLQDIFHSAGVTSGGGITDDADGTITVAAGTGLIRATNSAVAEILFADWSAEAGANVALTDNDMNYVYVEYNAGSPQAIATITKRTDTNTNIFLGSVYRIGTALHITQETRDLVGDHALNMVLRNNQIAPFARVSGGIISETGTRNLAATAGSWWGGLTPFTTDAKDTSVADTFLYVYDDGAGGWTSVASSTQFDNTQYDDGSGTLATLSNNLYGVHWVYLGADSDLYVLYGTTNGTLTAANDAGVPASVPPWFDEAHAKLLGKAIIKKSDAALTSIQSAFNSQFSFETASDHGGLTGLSDDDHTQYVLVDGSRVGRYAAGAIKTISTGVAATGTDRNLIIAAESGTADDLIEITGLTVGDTVRLRADTGDTITVKHNDAGATIKIYLYGNADVVLDEQNPLILEYVDTNVLSQQIDETGAGGGVSKVISVGSYNPASDYTETSTSYVDVDATNVIQTITLNGGGLTVVRFSFLARIGGTINANLVSFRVTDGTNNSNAIVLRSIDDNSFNPVTVIAEFDGLASGSTTFKLQWLASASTATIRNDEIDMSAWELS